MISKWTQVFSEEQKELLDEKLVDHKDLYYRESIEFVRTAGHPKKVVTWPYPALASLLPSNMKVK